MNKQHFKCKHIDITIKHDLQCIYICMNVYCTYLYAYIYMCVYEYKHE